MGLRINLALNISATYSDALDLTTKTYPFNYNPQYDFTSGPYNHQGELFVSDQRTISGSSTDTIQFCDGAGGMTIKDPYGREFSTEEPRFIITRAIIIIADEANGDTIEVGPNATNPWYGPFTAVTDSVTIQPGGKWMAVAPREGWRMSDDSSLTFELDITNNDASDAVYDIYILGAPQQPINEAN